MNVCWVCIQIKELDYKFNSLFLSLIYINHQNPYKELGLLPLNHCIIIREIWRDEAIVEGIIFQHMIGPTSHRLPWWECGDLKFAAATLSLIYSYTYRSSSTIGFYKIFWNQPWHMLEWSTLKCAGNFTCDLKPFSICLIGIEYVENVLKFSHTIWNNLNLISSLSAFARQYTQQ